MPVALADDVAISCLTSMNVSLKYYFSGCDKIALDWAYFPTACVGKHIRLYLDSMTNFYINENNFYTSYGSFCLVGNFFYKY